MSDLMTVREAVDALGVNYASIWLWIQQGKIEVLTLPIKLYPQVKPGIALK